MMDQRRLRRLCHGIIVEFNDLSLIVHSQMYDVFVANSWIKPKFQNFLRGTLITRKRTWKSQF